jgi:hypothetical protein
MYNRYNELQHIQIWIKDFNIINWKIEKLHQTSVSVSHLPGTVQYMNGIMEQVAAGALQNLAFKPIKLWQCDVDSRDSYQAFHDITKCFTQMCMSSFLFDTVNLFLSRCQVHYFFPLVWMSK